MHLKHCSSDNKTSCDLEFDKKCTKIGNHRCYKFKERSNLSGTHCAMSTSYINNQVQMLKSFNILLIQKFSVSAQVTSCQNFFPAHCTCVNFFWDDGLVQEFFSYAYALPGYFFKITPPPPPPGKKSKMVGPLQR